MALTRIDMLLAGQQEAVANLVRLHLRNAVRERPDRKRDHWFAVWRTAATNA